MGNPTKLEAGYEKLDSWWRSLPIVRDDGRLQALPFVLFLCLLFAASGVLVDKIVEWIGLGWEKGAQAALFAVLWIVFILVSLTTLAVRSAQRQSRNTKMDAS